MVRVVVAGPVGAGKSTLAQNVSEELSIPYVEMDALYHGPAWTKRPTFETDLEAFLRQPSWITEWQYPQARALLTQNADLFLWIDLPWPVVLYRVTKRTLRRWIRREELWAGNKEQPAWKILWDRSNMIRWSVVSRNHVADAIPELQERHPSLRVIRLRSRRQVAQVSAHIARHYSP